MAGRRIPRSLDALDPLPVLIKELKTTHWTTERDVWDLLDQYPVRTAQAAVRTVAGPPVARSARFSSLAARVLEAQPLA